MTPKNFILGSLLFAFTKDSLTKPRKKLFDSSERNIASHLRSAIEVFVSLYDFLSGYQVDTEYNRVGVGEECKKRAIRHGKKRLVVPDIIIHKRGEKVTENKKANYLCVEIKKIKKFDGQLNHIGNKEIKKRLQSDINKLTDFQQDEDFKYKYGISLVFSNRSTVFLKIGDNTYEKYLLEEIPIEDRETFLNCVRQAVSLTRKDNFWQNAEKQAKLKEYQHQIDQMVYELYGLTEEEIKIVEES